MFGSLSKSDLEKAYLEGFRSGYEKAWETMLPLVRAGMKESTKLLQDIAIKDTVERLTKK